MMTTCKIRLNLLPIRKLCAKSQIVDRGRSNCAILCNHNFYWLATGELWMTKRYVSMGLTAILAVVLIAGFGSAGTVGAQSATAAPTSAVAIKIGLVTDVGHVDDKGFNQSRWEGVQAVGTALGVPTEYLESNSASDYATNINALLNKGDNVIVTVGFNLQQATGDAAKANPNVLFIGVDQDQGTDPTA